ncbi:MafI family immunity protein [Pseudomonas sp. TWI628]|uniref:MafI family immunity protein n=1 Tax=Pseudomonas sp. TWI628 TaxID=3136788 RepID=UPI00320B785D
MSHLGNDLRADFVEALKEISTLMSMAYEQLGPVPQDHALAQAGLENGGEIVLDYVDHHEAGLAFEHLLYMIDEPPLVISEKCMAILDRIAKSLEMPSRMVT